MKARIEDQIRLPRTALLDLKRGPGGVIDVEFLAQYFQLANPDRATEFFPLSTTEVLDQSRHEGWLSDDDAAFLREHLVGLRLLQRGARLLWESGSDFFPAEQAELESLRRGLSDQLVGRRHLIENIEARCHRARAIVEKMLGRIRH
jgi:glutamate-ammonia-ligase adenylyltransferase